MHLQPCSNIARLWWPTGRIPAPQPISGFGGASGAGGERSAHGAYRRHLYAHGGYFLLRLFGQPSKRYRAPARGHEPAHDGRHRGVPRQPLMAKLWAEVYGTQHLGEIRATTAAVVLLVTAPGPGIAGRFIGRASAFHNRAMGSHSVSQPPAGWPRSRCTVRFPCQFAPDLGACIAEADLFAAPRDRGDTGPAVDQNTLSLPDWRTPCPRFP